MKVVGIIFGILVISQIVVVVVLEWMNRAFGGRPWSLFRRMPSATEEAKRE